MLDLLNVSVGVNVGSNANSSSSQNSTNQSSFKDIIQDYKKDNNSKNDVSKNEQSTSTDKTSKDKDINVKEDVSKPVLEDENVVDQDSAELDSVDISKLAYLMNQNVINIFGNDENNFIDEALFDIEGIDDIIIEDENSLIVEDFDMSAEVLLSDLEVNLENGSLISEDTFLKYLGNETDLDITSMNFEEIENVLSKIIEDLGVNITDISDEEKNDLIIKLLDNFNINLDDVVKPMQDDDIKDVDIKLTSVLDEPIIEESAEKEVEDVVVIDDSTNIINEEFVSLNQQIEPIETESVIVVEPKMIENPRIFAENIADEIVYNYDAGISEFNIKLNPGDLGEINITILFATNEITLTAVAENSNTQSLLLECHDSLKTILEQTVNSGIQVNIKEQQENFDFQQKQQQQQEQKGKQQKDEKSQEDETIDFLNQLRLGLLDEQII